jgi:glutamate dehydrogenase
MSNEQFNSLAMKMIKNGFNKYNNDQLSHMISSYFALLSTEYLDSYNYDDILNDIIAFDSVDESNPYAITLTKGIGERVNLWQIKLFRFEEKVSLSRGLPIIENFGVKLLDERPYKINLNDKIVYVCDFGVELSKIFNLDLTNEIIGLAIKDGIKDVFMRKMESDKLNSLTIKCGLNSRQIMLMRSFAHYIAQSSLPYSKDYIKECLSAYHNISKYIFTLFELKFDLKLHNKTKYKELKESCNKLLENVTNIDHDIILRAFISLVDALLRTNYYQLDHNKLFKDYISFKILSGNLEFLAKPKPLYEIFVYSLKMEGIHLRGGKVARGGIRWSDRREDFRTEVLGLVKAQMVKNSVIVPTGSKGGFICKKLPPIENREAYLNEGISCYRIFISSLLDITDNLVAGKIIKPEKVICYDDDDPYLVVAADKGTATFSDFANQLSVEYGFWLGDAFASGGSVGYDHKKMGITAKGAWESAKRHFRHLGINIQTQDFTVVGIGDMAGDVFGNGMLLSKHIRLKAAFNHQHIFLDPNPDAKVSFKERERLFKLPRSTWDDYNKDLISLGGGVFERNLKTIVLSNEVKQMLGINDNELAPNDLIKLLLQLDVDMLYNGGIGTYIKSEVESNEVVKDKANDNVRINGNQICAKVFVEGGNLGSTQLGRIEFAKNGGMIYTDAIDNSAGVDCSDHEVNIKILFASIMQTIDMSINERNKILSSMTDDVAQLVLKDNYAQTQILRYANKRAEDLFNIDINFIEKLEKNGELDRTVEFLPSNHEINERKRLGIGLTMPELSVLLAYSKIRIDHEILNSDLADNKIFEELLLNYFPTLLQKDFSEFIKQHYLRREIIANQLANLVVNTMGITFVSRLQSEFHLGIEPIIYAFWSSYKLINVAKIVAEIEALDNSVNADIQITLLIRIKKAVERLCRWILRNYKKNKDIVTLIDEYGNSFVNMYDDLISIIHVKDYPYVNHLESLFIQNNVSSKLSKLMSRSMLFPQLLDILIIAKETKHNLRLLMENYFYIGRVLRIDWLRDCIIILPEDNKWQALSRSALLTDGYSLYGMYTKFAVKHSISLDDNHFASRWIKLEKHKINKINEMLDELQTYRVVDLAMLSAVIRELSKIWQ